MKKTRILILDDSILTREALQYELRQDQSIEIVAKAANVLDARDKIIEYLPDILLADVHLGEMSGVEFVRQLLPQHNMPVIMMSTDASMEKQALEARACTFILKPSVHNGVSMEDFGRRVFMAIRTIVYDESPLFSEELLSSHVLVMGASTGGSVAVEELLAALPAVMPPIVVAQHMPPVFTATFAQRLCTSTRFTAKEAAQGEILRPGYVYIAPGGMHTTVAYHAGRLLIQLTENDAGLHNCPNVDLLFSSVAKAAGEKAVGIILTGMGKDGAKGLKAMRDAGAYTIGQDEQSSVVFGMPKVAHEIGAVQKQLQLNKIPAHVLQVLRQMDG